MGCLVDLHACPGGANASEHSGTNSSKAELWTSRLNLNLWKRCLVFLMQEISSHLPSVIGLQLCNEAAHGVPNLFTAYDEIINAVSAINASIPLYISDGWNAAEAVSYAGNNRNSSVSAGRCPVIIDTHMYWCFSQSDQEKSPGAIIVDVGRKCAAIADNCDPGDGGDATGIIIGEYSCVMSETSWAHVGIADRMALTKQFGLAQSAAYQKQTGGCYFWTLKMVIEPQKSKPDR